VKSFIAKLFEREVEDGVDPDEVVARGAVIQAGIISGAIREVVLLDVTPLSLGLETIGGLMNVVIPRNTTIPCRAGEMFTNAVSGQAAMKIRVLQGERELARDNWELGEVEVPFGSEAKGQARVGVQFALDANGLLEILARDTKTGEDRILRIESAAIDVADVKVEQMVSDSVEHAFSDLNARIFHESKLKAEEMLEALEMAMGLIGGELEGQNLEEVRNCEREVRRLLKSSEEDGAALKAAVVQLDQATEELAALLVTQAIGEES